MITWRPIEGVIPYFFTDDGCSTPVYTNRYTRWLWYVANPLPQWRRNKRRICRIHDFCYYCGPMEGSPLGLDQLSRVDYDRICLWEGNWELGQRLTAATYYPAVAWRGEKAFRDNAQIRAQKRDFKFEDYLARKQKEGFLIF